MKVAIIFSEGVKQINFTPENEDEKQALKLITPKEVNQCKDGYLRAFDNSESIMLVLTPKPKNIERVATAEKVAIEFTDSKLSKVNTLLSDDYKCGFKEGVQKYIENGGLY